MPECRTPLSRKTVVEPGPRPQQAHLPDNYCAGNIEEHGDNEDSFRKEPHSQAIDRVQ